MHNVSYQMSYLEKDVEREILSYETQESDQYSNYEIDTIESETLEPEQYSSFEIDQIESETLEPEQYSSFEIDQIESETLEPEQYSSFEIDEESSRESELDDPDLMRFMPAMYEIFLKQGETGFDEASEELARDMTQYWFSWKGLKKGIKKAAGSKLGKFLINQVKNRVPGAKAIEFAMSALKDPSKLTVKNLLKQAAFAAASSYLPPGVGGIANSLGIIPGAGAEKNKPAMGNLIKVVRDASEQVMNEVAESNDPLNPLEVNKIVTRAFEGQLQKNAVSTSRRRSKPSFVMSLPPNARRIRFYID
jgi:hypothetical protein